MQTRKERIQNDKRKKMKARGMTAASTVFAAVIASAGFSTSAKETHALTGFYKVKQGDTLYKISMEHDMTVKELKAVNRLKSDTIHPGQTLEVRTERHTEEPFNNETAIYTVVPGDTLWGIAKRYRMNVNELKTLNKLKRDMVLINQKLIIKGDISRTKAVITGAADNFTVEFKNGDDYFTLKVPYGTATSYQNMSGKEILVVYKDDALINIQ
ncbi:LysM peptidoglycan-binding domain-containing protein [Cytobacillus firmus]|uniref:Gamma-D-glutamate-meso-diaminopimelate muropeptidase n=1 Tax=Cytobacillus firmus DS1 TaxID=1307436 RepID=W7LJ27_CYTFI|nr:LysM peptidoglycan-binding domain-containing protein [Cytobacillus firmus]EWG12109.1 gamma-D-glutamate-meso-diaminopimelate muropeptidase [Cytobacillus firmus DS1]